ncbi:MAG: heparinase II/III family protein, partial [Gemmatimonadetes bacterium]|nr:heparinase II/III family protein [Gemmatimonadota bacterium]
YATAFVLALPEERWAPLLPPEHFAQLERMAELMVHVTRPGGRMAQVGDNDSGRFLKLLPPRDLSTLEEDFLDPRDSVAALNGLVRRADLAAFAGEPRVETELVRGLTGRAPAGAAPGDVARAERVRVGGEEAWSFLAEAPAGLAHATEFAAPGADLRDGARLFAYPDFGLYVFRSPRLFLAVRCGRRGQIATDGHAHLDELAVELTVDGRDVIADPGTYLYTALPARRNEYRSARAHFVPRRLAERADAALSGSLFELRGAPVGECLYWGPRGFVGRVVVDGAEVVRAVEVGAERVGVTDLVRSGGGWVEAGAPMVPEVPFSPGYGKRAVP